MTSSWFAWFISLATGIILAYIGSWYLTLLVFAGLLLIYIIYHQYAPQVFASLAIIIAGFLYFQLVDISVPQNLPSLNDTSLTGIVASYPVYDGTKTSFILKTDRKNIYQRQVRVVVYFAARIDKGDKISVQGSMKPPPPPSNPGEFNYPRYLAYKQVFYILSVKNEPDLKTISSRQGFPGWINAYRDQGVKLVNEALPAREAGILLGMLLGKTDGMDPEEYQDFQKTGILHVFSVSGLHVAFLLLLGAWLTSLLNLSPRMKLVVGISLLLLYGTMVGWPVSVVRAAIMGALGLLAYYAGRQNSMLNALGISGVIILLLNPQALMQISFQLSFMATFGLVYIFPLVRRALNIRSRCLDAILVPLCAEVAVLPLIAYHFNLFSPVSLVTNLVTGYLTGAAVILGFIAFMLVGLSSGLAGLFLYPPGLCIEIILALVGILKDLPGAYIWVVAPSIGLIVIYYTMLLTLLWGIANQKRKWAAGSLAVIMVMAASLYIPAGWHNRGVLEIVFIDVGQGDGILLKTPRGKFMLLDAGGSKFYDVGSLKVLPYLHRRGINELFLALNSHPDIDHVKGLETVLKDMPASYIGIPESIQNAGDYTNLRELARQQNICMVPLRQGQEINIEKGLHVKVLLPDGKEYACNNNNNQSLVLEVRYGNFAALFTGDIEEEAAQALLSDPIKAVTIVKVPHHGSKTSALTELYEQANPRYAVISVGANNTFGHPSPAVLEILQKRQIKILRTDRNGAIIFQTDGRQLKVETMFSDR